MLPSTWISTSYNQNLMEFLNFLNDEVYLRCSFLFRYNRHISPEFRFVLKPHDLIDVLEYIFLGAVQIVMAVFDCRWRGSLFQ